MCFAFCVLHTTRRSIVHETTHTNTTLFQILYWYWLSLSAACHIKSESSIQTQYIQCDNIWYAFCVPLKFRLEQRASNTHTHLLPHLFHKRNRTISISNGLCVLSGFMRMRNGYMTCACHHEASVGVWNSMWEVEDLNRRWLKNTFHPLKNLNTNLIILWYFWRSSVIWNTRMFVVIFPK